MCCSVRWWCQVNVQEKKKDCKFLTFSSHADFDSDEGLRSGCFVNQIRSNDYISKMIDEMITIVLGVVVSSLSEFINRKDLLADFLVFLTLIISVS